MNRENSGKAEKIIVYQHEVVALLTIGRLLFIKNRAPHK